MFKHPLNHSASELMHTHLKYPSLKCLNDKLYLFRVNLLNYLLNDVISVSIFDTLDDLRFYFLNELVLKGTWQNIQSLLHNSASILIARKFKNTSLDVKVQNLSLIRCAEFEHFLDDIIAKDVFHKLVRHLFAT